MPVKCLNYPSKVLTLIGLMLVGVVYAMTPASAQQPVKRTPIQERLLKQSVHVSLQKTSLAAVLSSLHQQYNLNFAVDGKPITSQKDLEISGTLQEALDTVASDFDYSWALTSSNVILMNKRFHNQMEMPQINLNEAKQTARDMLNALQGLPSHSDPTELGGMIFDMAHRLSAEQIHALRSGKLIPVTELSAEQYARAQAAMYCAGFGQTYRMWNDLLTLLTALPGKSLDSVNYHSRSEYTFFLTEGGKAFPYPFSLGPTRIISAMYPEK